MSEKPGQIKIYGGSKAFDLRTGKEVEPARDYQPALDAMLAPIWRNLYGDAPIPRPEGEDD